jgi:1-acyl-sn-glycerol-3-phosphate acyltransferase
VGCRTELRAGVSGVSAAGIGVTQQAENVMSSKTIAPSSSKRGTGSWGFLVRMSASWIVISCTALIMLAVAFLTAFKARRFSTEVIAKAGATIVLRLFGVRVAVHQDRPFPREQVVYISNHTSSLDIFVLIALGLPNTRFFLKREVRKKSVPLGIIADLAGTFFTVPQEYPEQRRRIFQQAELALHRSRESVYLSPEGTRTLSGKIGPFNKGAFHLATNLRAPIIPLYIQIPREIDPGRGVDVRASGAVHVYVRSPVSTSEWKVDELNQNRDRMHQYYVSLHEELKQANQ